MIRKKFWNLRGYATIVLSRFVLKIKNVGEKEELLKARLVIVAHVDPDKAQVVNEAPTLLKSSIRLIVAFAAAHSFKMWSRDVPQAFGQSKDASSRKVYIGAPRKDEVLKHIDFPKSFFYRQ